MFAFPVTQVLKCGLSLDTLSVFLVRMSSLLFFFAWGFSCGFLCFGFFSCCFFLMMRVGGCPLLFFFVFFVSYFC